MWWFRKDEVDRQFSAMPVTLNLEVADKAVVPLVPAGSQLPAVRTETFRTGSLSFDDITLSLLVGESSAVSKNRRIGKVRIVGIPLGPVTSAEVQVTVCVDTHGRINVDARVGEQMLEVRSTLKRPSEYLSDNAISKIRAKSLKS